MVETLSSRADGAHHSLDGRVLVDVGLCCFILLFRASGTAVLIHDTIIVGLDDADVPPLSGMHWLLFVETFTQMIELFRVTSVLHNQSLCFPDPLFGIFLLAALDHETQKKGFQFSVDLGFFAGGSFFSSSDVTNVSVSDESSSESSDSSSSSLNVSSSDSVSGMSLTSSSASWELGGMERPFASRGLLVRLATASSGGGSHTLLSCEGSADILLFFCYRRIQYC